MTDTLTQPPLNELERVANVFVAPSRTFIDILRSPVWWFPFLLLVLVTTAVTFTIDKKVGFVRAAENQVHFNPKQEDTLNQLSPEQRSDRMRVTATLTRYISYASPVVVLAFSATGALVLWGSFNFGLGTKTTYGQMFAVWVYASLPRLLGGLLTIATILFGGSPEGFNLRDPVGTNVAYYLPDIAPWLRAALGFADFIGIWNTILLIIGTSIVARVKLGSAAAIVVGWWFLALILSVGAAAAFG